MSSPSLHEILLNSNEVKRLIVERSFKYGIPLEFVALEAGIRYKDLMGGYINEKTKPSGISEAQFKKMFEVLGMDLRYQVVIDTTVDMKALAGRINDKYRDKAQERRTENRKYND